MHIFTLFFTPHTAVVRDVMQGPSRIPHTNAPPTLSRSGGCAPPSTPSRASRPSISALRMPTTKRQIAPPHSGPRLSDKSAACLTSGSAGPLPSAPTAGCSSGYPA